MYDVYVTYRIVATPRDMPRFFTLCIAGAALSNFEIRPAESIITRSACCQHVALWRACAPERQYTQRALELALSVGNASFLNHTFGQVRENAERKGCGSLTAAQNNFILVGMAMAEALVFLTVAVIGTFLLAIRVRLVRQLRRHVATRGHGACAVCMEDITEKEVYARLRCNHDFHYTCIDRWITFNAGRAGCPVCREPIGVVRSATTGV